FTICGLPPERSFTALALVAPGLAALAPGLAFAPDFGGDLDLVAGEPFWAAAAFTSALNAPASTFSPSWMSIALRVLPSKLELKMCDGSGIVAPRANVSFTTFVYVSPVQTIPWCDQTGTPAIAFDGFLQFRSSIISGSASRISALMRARVWPRQSPFVRALAVFLALVVGLRAPLVRDVRLAFGFAIFSVIIRPLLLDVSQVAFG